MASVLNERMRLCGCIIRHETLMKNRCVILCLILQCVASLVADLIEGCRQNGAALIKV